MVILLQRNGLLGNFLTWHSWGCYFATYHPPKHYCRSNGNTTSNDETPTPKEYVPCHTASTIRERIDEYDKEPKAFKLPSSVKRLWVTTEPWIEERDQPTRPKGHPQRLISVYTCLYQPIDVYKPICLTQMSE